MTARGIARYRRVHGCLVVARPGQPNRGGYVIETTPSPKSIKVVLS